MHNSSFYFTIFTILNKAFLELQFFIHQEYEL